MQGIRILGVDPGFRNIGLALMLYNPGVGVELLSLKLIETKKDDGKRGLRAKSDDLRCLEIIREEADAFIRCNPFEVVAFEEVPCLRSARASQKVAMGWSVVWTLATSRAGVVSFEYPIKELKKCVTGSTQASKEDMVEALSQRYPALKDFDADLKKTEHVADAMAAALLCTQDSVVKALAASLDRVTA